MNGRRFSKRGDLAELAHDLYYAILPEVGVYSRDYREYKELKEAAYSAIRSNSNYDVAEALDEFSL